MTTEERTARRAVGPRFMPAADVLAGETADVYFERARRILAAEGMDPVVTMEIFAREEAVLCGAEEALAYLRAILGGNGRVAGEPTPLVESLHDGDTIGPKEVVMRITARYSSFGLYETAILGILSQSTGWATAARGIVEAAAPIPVIGFGARHVHPAVADQMDYASVVGGCVGASTPAGARLAGLAPTGTMPHALIIIFGDTVRAARGVRSAHRPRRAADRAGRHLQGRSGGVAASCGCARGSAMGGAARHSVGTRPGHRRPGQGGPRQARPGWA